MGEGARRRDFFDRGPSSDHPGEAAEADLQLRGGHSIKRRGVVVGSDAVHEVDHVLLEAP